jgi:hypothetical protein
LKVRIKINLQEHRFVESAYKECIFFSEYSELGHDGVPSGFGFVGVRMTPWNGSDLGVLSSDGILSDYNCYQYGTPEEGISPYCLFFFFLHEIIFQHAKLQFLIYEHILGKSSTFFFFQGMPDFSKICTFSIDSAI